MAKRRHLGWREWGAYVEMRQGVFLSRWCGLWHRAASIGLLHDLRSGGRCFSYVPRYGYPSALEWVGQDGVDFASPDSLPARQGCCREFTSQAEIHLHVYCSGTLLGTYRLERRHFTHSSYHN